MQTYASFRDYPADKWRWPNFRPNEMACRGTGKLGIDEHSMDCLQSLRETLNSPLIIHSAYRSPEHNRAVGGAKHSQHLLAKAFDVSMLNHDPIHFEEIARRCGFTSFGHYPKQNFMHIDTRAVAARWNSGGWFPPREDRFAAEPEPKRKTNAAINGGVIVASGPIVESALRELAPQMPEFYVPYILGTAVVIGAGVAIYTLIRRHSKEPE